VLSALSSIAQSAHKMTNDTRMLQHLKEVEEPFEKKQIGSSAMAYKRNPMRSERVASLSRYVESNLVSAAMTASTQWFERTLDDSANRRIILPESFMAIDAVLDILSNVCSGLVVYKEVIRKHVMAEIPFMATENIIMEAVKKGGDRQELHEAIRVHSMEAGRQVKEFGRPNDLLERIAKDPMFGLTEDDVKKLTEPSDYIGRSAEQTAEFLEEYIKPVIEENKEYLGHEVELIV
ncbi:MAG: adenylosuccinate lyase, partial [Clostridia bacterium]|nr:adenylosuccinate lyase [Clostridia bacterium]